MYDPCCRSIEKLWLPNVHGEFHSTTFPSIAVRSTRRISCGPPRHSAQFYRQTSTTTPLSVVSLRKYRQACFSEGSWRSLIVKIEAAIFFAYYNTPGAILRGLSTFVVTGVCEREETSAVHLEYTQRSSMHSSTRPRRRSMMRFRGVTRT